jgi:hypothetical protein
MSLDIIEIHNTLQHLRLAPQNGVLLASAPSNTFPMHCGCANRLGPLPPAGDETTDPPIVRRRNSAFFAALGR